MVESEVLGANRSERGVVRGIESSAHGGSDPPRGRLNDLADLAAPETPVKLADGLVKSLSDPALREQTILDPHTWFLAPFAVEPSGGGQ